VEEVQVKSYRQQVNPIANEQHPSGILPVRWLLYRDDDDQQEI